MRAAFIIHPLGVIIRQDQLDEFRFARAKVISLPGDGDMPSLPAMRPPVWAEQRVHQ